MESDLRAYIRSQIEETRILMGLLLKEDELLNQLEAAIDACVKCLRAGGRILLAGNGGSAADAQHIAGELVSRFAFERPGLPVLALTTDSSVLTAIGNDDGYQHIFSRQINAHGKKGDVFIAYSTSGNSTNIVKALEEARRMGVVSVGLTGNQNGVMVGLCDHIISVPSGSTPKIQECHLVLGHIICGIIEREIFRGAD